VVGGGGVGVFFDAGGGGSWGGGLAGRGGLRGDGVGGGRAGGGRLGIGVKHQKNTPPKKNQKKPNTTTTPNKTKNNQKKPQKKKRGGGFVGLGVGGGPIPLKGNPWDFVSHSPPETCRRKRIFSPFTIAFFDLL